MQVKNSGFQLFVCGNDQRIQLTVGGDPGAQTAPPVELVVTGIVGFEFSRINIGNSVVDLQHRFVGDNAHDPGDLELAAPHDHGALQCDALGGKFFDGKIPVHSTFGKDLFGGIFKPAQRGNGGVGEGVIEFSGTDFQRQSFFQSPCIKCFHTENLERNDPSAQFKEGEFDESVGNAEAEIAVKIHRDDLQF